MDRRVTEAEGGRPVPGRPRVSFRSSLTAEENARADAALVRSGGSGGRVASLTDRSVSVGVGVRGPAPYLLRARRVGLAVVRRTSGGTAVVHGPGDLAWSVVVPRRDPRAGPDFVRAYGRLGAGVVRFLARRGIVASWEPSPGLSAEYCLLGPRGHALAVGDRILGGAAQHATATSLLHHGIVPLEVDRPLIAGIFGWDSPGPADRLIGMRELGIADPSETLGRDLAAALEVELAPPGSSAD